MDKYMPNHLDTPCDSYVETVSQGWAGYCGRCGWSEDSHPATREMTSPIPGTSYGAKLPPAERAEPSDAETAAYVADLRTRLARAGKGSDVLVPELQALLTQYPSTDEQEIRARLGNVCAILSDAFRSLSRDTQDREAMQALDQWLQEYRNTVLALPYDAYQWLGGMIATQDETDS